MLKFLFGTLKGGPGKTTTSVNVASALALAGNRVLLVDFDLQADTTMYMGVQPSASHSVGTLLLEPNLNPADHILDRTELIDYNPNGGRLLLLPAELDSLERAAYETQRVGRLQALTKLLDQLGDIADYVIIDSKPELGWLHQLASITGDAAVAIMQPELMTARGMIAFRTSLNVLNENRDKKIHFLGVVLNRYEESEEATWVDNVLAEQQIPVFKTKVPRSRLISKAYAYGKPVTLLNPSSSPAAIYVDLAGELQQRAASMAAA
ncbi:ParA family protein (plasmid) [Nonomuraea sp. NBC_00507]|uniref:ParA family protein n=1 Tax=Nonomuraea sp. NBC_00507 TaxID=2976002 RepID=UPI002E199663